MDKRSQLTRLLLAFVLVSFVPAAGEAGVVWHSALDGDATALVGADGIATGTPTATADFYGNLSGAVLFGGQSDQDYYTITPPTTSLMAGSISVWIKPLAVDTTEDGVVAVGASGGGSDVYFSFMNSTNQRWRVDLDDGASRRDVMSNTTPDADAWYHMVVTFDSSVSGSNELRMYIDGVLQTDFQSISGDNDPYNLSHPWLIGTERTSERYFNGAIDDVRIYDSELSRAEVSALYEAGPLYDAAPIPEPASLLLVAMGLLGVARRRRRTA